MRTVFGFVVLAALCVAGAWWVAGLPGTVSANIAGTTIETSTPVALTLATVLFLVLYVLLRTIAALVRIPRVARHRRHMGNRKRGDAAVTRTLVALAANDVSLARREAERSRRLLGETPLTLLMTAQAERQAGREDAAADVYKKLAARGDGKLLGLRGLLRQAMAQEDWAAASALAKQAEASHPGAAWLRTERRHLALRTGQYAEALRLSPPLGKGAKTHDRGMRAALGVAAADAETDPAAALKLAQQAWEAEPSLAPAAVAYATRLLKAGKERQATDTLRRAWALLPHPDVAEAYLAPALGATARYRRAPGLISANAAHPASALLLAQTALEADLVADAKRHVRTAQQAGLADKRLYALLADIAHAEGDASAEQDALRRGAQAAPEPHWQCEACGTQHSGWQAVCSACGTPGQVRWATKPRKSGQVLRLPPAAVVEGFV